MAVRSMRISCLILMKKMMMMMMRCIICVLVSWIPTTAASSMLCPSTSTSSSLSQQFPILDGRLTSQCPFSFHPTTSSSLLYVNGEFLDRVLTSQKRNSYTAVLFYARWCPFSESAHKTFELLSSMYPHIDHLAVEKSSATPSLFSRFGIHGLPAIVMVSQNLRMRYHGSKDLVSLVELYKLTTGSEPVEYIAINQSGNAVISQKLIMQSWIESSMKEILTREPYLILSMLFLFIRVVVHIIPRVLYRLKAIWAFYQPHLNLEIFGETSQILGCIGDMIDVKRMWTKLRFCKNRNIHWGTRNARLWASSLASVSLGETSQSRLSS